MTLRGRERVCPPPQNASTGTEGMKTLIPKSESSQCFVLCQCTSHARNVCSLRHFGADIDHAHGYLNPSHDHIIAENKGERSIKAFEADYCGYGKNERDRWG
jgi:hypothetical protein